MNIVAIIQARLGSARLPMKSLLSLCGTPVIDWVVDRVGRSRRISRIAAAIPDTPLDAVLHKHLKNRNVPVVTGSETDVLSRFAKAARETDADMIVRVCADNPFIWPDAIDRLVEFFLADKLDYAYNHIPRHNLWPDGLGAEIISRDVLLDIAEKAKLPSQREHCLNYIWDNLNDFASGTFNPDEKWLQRPDIKLDLDTPEDFRRLALLPVFPEIGAEEIISTFDSARGEENI